MNRLELFRELTNRGVAKAVVSFSGGGDEGGVEEIQLLNEAGEEIGTLEEEYGYWTNPETKKWEPKLRTKDGELAKLLGEPVYDKYCSFAGEFHVSGEVVWDVKNQTVKMNGLESVDEDFEEHL